MNSMTCGRHAFSLVEHDGWIYAAGGSDFSRTEYNTVERYDPVRQVISLNVGGKFDILER